LVYSGVNSNANSNPMRPNANMRVNVDVGIANCNMSWAYCMSNWVFMRVLRSFQYTIVLRP
jgi:hypothetical protein